MNTTIFTLLLTSVSATAWYPDGCCGGYYGGYGGYGCIGNYGTYGTASVGAPYRGYFLPFGYGYGTWAAGVDTVARADDPSRKEQERALANLI